MKHELQLPSFNDKQGPLQQYSYTYREGGLRLEQQSISNKQIFHNFGQGGSEYSLSFGSAYIVCKIFSVKQDTSKIKEVAVIGQGINAMMTALQLLKRGYKVSLYSKKFPIYKDKNNEKVIEHQEGLQLWYPGSYDNCDPLKHELVSKLSFEFFKQCYFSNRYQSLKLVTCYCAGPKVEDLKANVTEFINPQIKDIKVSFGEEKSEQFTSYKTILIDTELFMEEIFTELKLRNVVLFEKEFKSISDVLSIKQSYIFNCLGIENKQFFGDPVSELKGCFFNVQKQTNSQPQSLAIWISSQSERQDFLITVSNKKMHISTQGIYVKSKEQLEEVGEKILTRAYYFVKQRTLNPSKL